MSRPVRLREAVRSGENPFDRGDRLGDTPIMELVEFEVGDRDQLDAFVELTRAIDAIDCPWEPERTTRRQAMEMQHGWEGEPGRWFVAYDGRDPVGTASIHSTEYDNLEMARLSVRVAPSYRRRGHGTAILHSVESRAIEMGRRLFHLSEWDSTATQAFAAARGYGQKSAEIRRMQVVKESPELEPIRDEAAARARDYEIVRIEGYSPSELLPALVALTTAINDAPTDDLEWEDEIYSVDRVRAYERAQVESGYRLRRIVALHRPSGQPAGHTVVAVDGERPEIAEQHDTSVVRGHRGHGLGLLLKTEMLLWLAETDPQLERVYTWNAETNRHMIAVNERLGYRPIGRAAEFQRRVS